MKYSYPPPWHILFKKNKNKNKFKNPKLSKGTFKKFKKKNNKSQNIPNPKKIPNYKKSPQKKSPQKIRNPQKIPKKNPQKIPNYQKAPVHH